MSSDEYNEYINSIIEYDPYSSENEKENIDQNNEKSVKISKKRNMPRTTETQFTMLISFMQDGRDFVRGSLSNTAENLKFLKEWSLLVDQLNANGPPIRSTTDWRKVWSEYKSRKKSTERGYEDSTTTSEGVDISGVCKNISGVGNLKASTSSDNNFAKKEKSANSESEKTSSSSYDNFNKESDASLLSISEKLDKILKYQEESKIQLVQIKEYIEQGLELLKQSKIVDKTNV